MRTLAVVVAISFLAGCGSAVEPGAEGEPIDDRAAVDSTPPSGPDSSTTTTTPATTSTLPGQAVAFPEDGLPPDDTARSLLSIEDALLPDDAFDPPWEPQRRNLDVRGYDVGPNQTDCDDYWAYEQLLAADGGHVMWWIDGGNANHRVTRIDDLDETIGLLMHVAGIAENCPTVTWLEGGAFTVEAFTPDIDGFIMRFDDPASGEATWVAITLFGDLLSVLHMPLWTRADGTMLEVTVDDITAIAEEMSRRLHDAGPERTPVPTSTAPTPKIPTVVAPPPLPDVATTSTAPTPEIPTVVAPPPLPDVAPTTTVALDEIGELLLTADEAPSWLQLDGIEASTPGGSDDEFVEACPAADSLDEIDRALTWQAEFETIDGGEALQLIGEMDDAGAASDAVARFAQVASCDLETLMPGATGSGGAIELGGADVAGTLFLESRDLIDTRLELGVAAIGSIVVVFTIETRYDPATAGEQLLEFMSLGVDKIVSR